MFTVELTKTAEKAFDHLMKSRPEMAKRVANAIEAIGQNPSEGIPLRGELKGLFKYRVGAYRILYSIKRHILLVTVIDIGHRKEVYR